MTDKILKSLPRTESTYYIILVLIEPLHGYGVMKKVEQLTREPSASAPERSMGLSRRLRSRA